MAADAVLHVPSTAGPLQADWRWKRLDEICDGIFDCPHSTPVLTSEGPYIARSQTFAPEYSARRKQLLYQRERSENEQAARGPNTVIFFTAAKARISASQQRCPRGFGSASGSGWFC